MSINKKRYDENIMVKRNLEVPKFLQNRDIPHYYGDSIRIFFLVIAVFWGVTTPTYGNLLPFGLVWEIVGLVLLVLLAGLTNPKGEWVMLYNAVVSGIGLFLFEAAAIRFYAIEPFPAFLMREAIAFLFLLAFYLSVKTVRAMWSGMIEV